VQLRDLERKGLGQGAEVYRPDAARPCDRLFARRVRAREPRW
jgi:hypothetical protein